MTQPEPSVSTRAILDWLGQVYADKRFIVACPVLQSSAGLARRARELGASDTFLLAGRVGTGDVPTDLGPLEVLNVPPADTVAGIHLAENAFRNLPSTVLKAIDAFDPEGSALALGAFFGDGRPIAGRRMYGARPPAWQALEDKVIIDALWDDVGVDRSPCEIVPVAEASDAAARLDIGAGTVWAGDARDGFNGGAVHTFHVYDAMTQTRALDFLNAHADRVRVMPFLEGIPCSIHGLVLESAVLTFRPAEMVVLRTTRGSGFKYLRAATAWDPPPEDREAMRTLARRVGQHLRETVSYRGGFTIDGILTCDGFRPTELNPRVGAAMGMIVRNLPLSLMHYALIEGERFPVDPTAWEAECVADSDANRVARLGFTFDTEYTTSRRFALRRTSDGEFEEQEEEEGADVLGIVGPGPGGGFVNFVLQASVMPKGESVSPVAAALVHWSNRHLDAQVGPVTPATSVR